MTTPLMTPGNVISHHINLPQLIQPIFLVGADARSKEWLLKYQDRLKAIHAIGFLIQADNKQAISRMQQLAPNLTLLPVSANALSQSLQLKHYPVLISHQRIEQ